jgi:putative PEP-CTERM system histidine kinase
VWGASAASFLLALGAVVRKRRTVAGWFFALGMVAFATDTLLAGFALQQSDLGRLAYIYEVGFTVKAVATGIWICFSAVYARGEARASLRRTWLLALAISLFPMVVLAISPGNLIEAAPLPETGGVWLKFLPGAQVINGAFLIGCVFILTNLERTFRAAVGTMQWRIKFLILGLALIFGARIYTHSQGLLFSGHNTSLTQVENIALLIGCALITVAYFRHGFEEMDVYPSRAVLHASVTVLLVGGYLFVVGILAQLVERTGGAASFQLQAFLVLIGVAFLAILLLSERLRHRVRDFVSHHFSRPRYDSRQIWERFTRSTSKAIDEESLCTAASALISQTFNAMSVSIWIFDEVEERLSLAASTSESRRRGQSVIFPAAALRTGQGVINLERRKEEWAASLRSLSETQFKTGGDRVCLPLRAAERCLGIALLADRVRGVAYSWEEHELLVCIGDQITSGLLNLRLTREILLAKELEAFQTISAFFVHDLKNAASTLNLMLQNLPVHFNNPEFLRDALLSIGGTNNRINQIIERLSSLGNKLELQAVEVDLNALVEQAVQSLHGSSGIEVVKELRPVPRLSADADQLRSVVANLLLNAQEALGPKGRIVIKTGQHDGWATLSVEDNGCGMTPEFARDSLFRPFKTTKKKGIGIGMFQTKMIVEAHGGTVRVKTEAGSGTTIDIALPAGNNFL